MITKDPQKLKGLGILLIIIGVSFVIYLFRDQLRELERFGYVGLFLITFLLNSTLVVPLPAVAISSAMGMVYDPFWVGLFAGSGAALGEIFGYLAGKSGREVLLKHKGGLKIEQQLRKYGGPGIMLLALIPNPAFDLVGIAAGAIKIPFLRFLLWCWIGKVLKFLAFAYLGDFFPAIPFLAPVNPGN